MRRIFCMAALLISCGGTLEFEGGDGSMGSENPLPNDAWTSMTAEQKQAIMLDEVMPTMAAKFRAFDASRYDNFTCATCHGDDMASVGFRMPNKLTPLDPANIDISSGVGAFMANEVVPNMVSMLQTAPYDRETQQGFGCFSCHPRL